MTGRTDWERAYRRLEREREVLPRTGLDRRSHRLARLWRWQEERLPEWLPDPVHEVAGFLTERLVCLVHNHTPYTEMDNRTIVCAVCRRRLGEHPRRP